MTKELSTEEWLDAVTKRAEGRTGRPGVEARAQFVLPGAPDGPGECSVIIEDGALTGSDPGTVEDPDVTMTLPWRDALDVASGELDLNVAFMQGTMKVAGDTGKLFEILSLLRVKSA